MAKLPHTVASGFGLLSTMMGLAVAAILAVAMSQQSAQMFSAVKTGQQMGQINAAERTFDYGLLSPTTLALTLQASASGPLATANREFVKCSLPNQSATNDCQANVWLPLSVPHPFNPGKLWLGPPNSPVKYRLDGGECVTNAPSGCPLAVSAEFKASCGLVSACDVAAVVALRYSMDPGSAKLAVGRDARAVTNKEVGFIPALDYNGNLALVGGECPSNKVQVGVEKNGRPKCDSVKANDLSGFQDYEDFPIRGVRYFGRIDGNGATKAGNDGRWNAQRLSQGQYKIAFHPELPKGAGYTVLITLHNGGGDHIGNVYDYNHQGFKVKTIDAGVSGGAGNNKPDDTEFSFMVVF